MISRNGSAVEHRGTADDREAAVVARLQTLAPHLDGEPDPAFRAATRARLVAMAAVRSPEPEPVSPLRRLMTLRSADAVPTSWRTRLTAGLAGAALAVTGLASAVALSADARPGEVLYGLKRGTEQTQLALAGDSRRGAALLDLASTRLDELEYLVSEDAGALPYAAPADGTTAVLAAGADTELVLQTLDTMDAQTTEGAALLAERAVETEDAGPLTQLSGWATEQSAGLAALEPDVPEAARPAFDDSQDLLARIGTRTADLQTVLDCSAGPATGGADDLGPLPGTCPTAPADGADPGTTPGAGGSTPSEGATGGTPGQTSGDPAAPTPGTPEGQEPGGDEPGGVPGGEAPAGIPTPGTPGSGLPSLPVPVPVPVPNVDGTPPGTPGLPTVPLPGSQSAATPSPDLDVDVDVCLGPITLGDC